jgi:xylan 1,4-beta-xylosidase
MPRLAIALRCGAACFARAQTPVAIWVDLGRLQGAYQAIYRWLGYDESHYTTAKNGRQLLRELHDLSPEPVYLRAHHLFTSGDGTAQLKWSSSNVFTPDAAGKPVYDFRIRDGIFDAYRDAGVRPMVVGANRCICL